MTADQQALYDAYRVWALKIASRVANQSQLNATEAEPLKTAALVGLIQAAQRFDPSRGLAFKTMAAMRIAGAATDCLRTESWVPRGVYSKTNPRECWKQVREQGLRKVSLNQPAAHSDTLRIQDLIRLQMKTPAIDNVDAVDRLLRMLQPKERQVLQAYFLQDKSMKEIGVEMGLSESRVCQLHGSAIAYLRRVGRSVIGADHDPESRD